MDKGGIASTTRDQLILTSRLEVREESQVGFNKAGSGRRGTSPGELDRILCFEEDAKETDTATPSKRGSNGKGKVLLGKIHRPKKEQ